MPEAVVLVVGERVSPGSEEVSVVVDELVSGERVSDDEVGAEWSAALGCRMPVSKTDGGVAGCAPVEEGSCGRRVGLARGCGWTEAVTGLLRGGRGGGRLSKLAHSAFNEIQANVLSGFFLRKRKQVSMSSMNLVR